MLRKSLVQFFLKNSLGFSLRLILVLIAFSGPIQASEGAVILTIPTQPSVDIKSYHEWKRAKVYEIENKIRKLKEGIGSLDPNISGAASRVKIEAGLGPRDYDELGQEMLNLANSKDLTISDYFVGYLIKQNSLDAAIMSVSGRLTPEDIAELMKAYAEQFSKVRYNDGKTATRLDSGI